MCHYVRMLVEVDLKNPLQDRIMVERPGYCSFAYIQYESLPAFCTSCCVIGHSVVNCNNSKEKEVPQNTHMQKGGDMEKGSHNVNGFQQKKDGQRESVQQRPIEDSVSKEVALSNSFEVLASDVDQSVLHSKASAPPSSDIFTAKLMDVSGVLGVPVRSILKKNQKIIADTTELKIEDERREGLKDATLVTPPKFYPIALCTRIEDSPARRRKFGSVNSQVHCPDELVVPIQDYSNFANSKQPP